MLRLAADENFNNDILRGLFRRKRDLDIVRVQDAGLSGASDSTILQWCADQGRILLTHDVSTITKHAYERLANKQPMPGVFEINRTIPHGLAIDDILLLAEYSSEGEWEGQIYYLPLR
ncbi:MAG: DUF5615 family PIN-like protein [Candidatus Binatia bacterium]